MTATATATVTAHRNLQASTLNEVGPSVEGLGCARNNTHGRCDEQNALVACVVFSCEATLIGIVFSHVNVALLIATGSFASESDQSDDTSSGSSSNRSLSSEEDIIETDYHDPVSPVLYL